jgi:hypothetical protein
MIALELKVYVNTKRIYPNDQELIEKSVHGPLIYKPMRFKDERPLDLYFIPHETLSRGLR